MIYDNEYFMRLALKEAENGLKKDEVPIGAIITYKNQIIARAHNQTEQLNDVTAHAEMLAFTSATNHIGGKYLNECTLYVTLEPCIMCAGAAYWTQIGAVVYGASDSKRGFSIFKNDKIFHPKTTITGGVLADECAQLVKDFFKKKR